MKDFFRDGVEILLPRRCGVCGAKLIRAEKCICTACTMKMPLTWFWTMERNPMSDKFNLRIQRLRDDAGDTNYEKYSYAAALYFYKEDYRGISQALKYDADIALGKHVGTALGNKLSGSKYFRDVDLVIPVPLHWLRRLSRGYNQAEIIALALCAELPAANVDTSVLKRKRRTKSQTTIDIKNKAANVHGAFAIDREKLAEICHTDAPKHILLVDDVFTTGSTICECQRQLRHALVELLGIKKAAQIRISAATLAYVGD